MLFPVVQRLTSNEFLGPLIYTVLGRVIGRFCFHIFGRLEIRGEEHIPKHGAVIFVCNHVTHKDVPNIVASTCRRMYFIAKDDLFQVPIIGWVLRKVETISLGRSSTPVDAIRQARQRLEKGDAVVIFPEEHRSKGLGMRKFTTGAAYLAAKCPEALIIPVGVEGTDEYPDWLLLFPPVHFAFRLFPLRLFRRQVVRVTFGEGFQMAELADGEKPSMVILEPRAAFMQDRVEELLSEKYKIPFPEEETVQEGAL